MSVTSESIFNLIPKPQKLPEKRDIYRSKYDPKAPLTGSTFGLHGTTVTVGKGINDELKKVCLPFLRNTFVIHCLFVSLHSFASFLSFFNVSNRHVSLALPLGQHQKKQILPTFFVEVVKNKFQNKLKISSDLPQ